MLAVVTVLTASLMAAYTLIGYPLLLGSLARRRSRPIRRAPISPPVSIIIAVHNGERFIEDKLHLEGAGRFRLLGPTGRPKDARLLRLCCSDSVLQFQFASP